MIIHFDSVGGASGDMILGALSDLGADLGAIATQLHAILPDHFHIDIQKVTEGGIAGTRVTVDAHDHHDHDGHEGHHHHHHRGLSDILAMLEHAPHEAAARLAAEVFRTLAVAEATVHGTTPEAIHFHEVGAVDAIVDIYGSCLALFQLGVTEVAVGALPEGHGTVTCAHGVMPIPAPATAELLKGHSIQRVDEPFELVTPTGAALLMTWKKQFPAVSPVGVPVRSGIGFGQRTLNARPNLLRAMLSQKVDSDLPAFQPSSLSALLQMETNIDDATPEVLAYTVERLLEAGALDAWHTPIIMKKGRPATQLCALCSAAAADALSRIIFRETPTLGIRRFPVERTALERTVETVETPYGALRVKKTPHGAKPEYEDCRRIALAHDLPLHAVQRLAGT
ncbi:MAG: nickel pincer cofactor biosynthesis protein LarC [Kiritimatiellaeota bacterium]|nr:nickel pincer cofactor biosynthesis protein LarC [Kiritimatiellota bacterium]